MNTATAPTGPGSAARRALALAALLAWGTACGGGAPDPFERVVVVVLDSTHAAHLGSYGGPAGLTPNLDALAAAGVRFDRSFSNNTWTLSSTVSLMTGLVQEHHGVVTNRQTLGDSLPAMAEVFRDAGFATGAWVEMLYASRPFGLDRGFESFAYSGYLGAQKSGELTERARQWVERHAEERFFAYVHLRRPHSPYDPKRTLAEEVCGPWPFATEAAARESSQADTYGDRVLPPDERERIAYLYRANLAVIDRQLAPFLETCRELDDTLVVLTSDHGEGLGEHDFYGHGQSLWAEVVDIPLVFAGDGLAPAVDDAPACTVDVFPTLLELTGLAGRTPPGLDGESLAARVRGTGPRERARGVALSSRYLPDAEHPPFVGWVEGGRKAVLAPDGAGRAFDRTEDRSERLPPGELDGALRERLLALRELGTGHALRTGDAELSDEQSAELEALGYHD